MCGSILKCTIRFLFVFLCFESDALYASRIIAGLFGHLWCYPLQLACTFQKHQRTILSLLHHGIQRFSHSFIVYCFFLSFLYIFPRSRPPCLFRLCLPPIHKSWLRILFLGFLPFLSFLEFPPSSRTPYLKRTRPPPTSLLVDVPSIP
ncbi:hypothetical protein V8C40DRAFT_241399 [Trichoderma camerunense]